MKEIKLREVKCNHRKSKVVGTQGSSLRETEAERNWEKREERAETKRHYEREGGGIGRELEGGGGGGGVGQEM